MRTGDQLLARRVEDQRILRQKVDLYLVAWRAAGRRALLEHTDRADAGFDDMEDFAPHRLDLRDAAGKACNFCPALRQDCGTPAGGSGSRKPRKAAKPSTSSRGERHLARKAIVYLRQSSEKQVRQNKESQLLQYAMAERVRALGWAGGRDHR